MSMLKIYPNWNSILTNVDSINLERAESSGSYERLLNVVSVNHLTVDFKWLS